MVEIEREESGSGTSLWKFCNRSIPSREVIFFTQVVILYIVVLVSLANLSLSIGNQTLWSSLLSGCLGYLLPSPSIKKKKKNESFLYDPSEQ